MESRFGLPSLRGRQALAFTEDRGSFARASRRCLGVGRCVTASGGVMCPSYRATGEENDTTIAVVNSARRMVILLASTAKKSHRA